MFNRRKKLYRRRTTWGWVNDRIFIFGWNVPLTKPESVASWYLGIFFQAFEHLQTHITSLSSRFKLNTSISEVTFIQGTRWRCSIEELSDRLVIMATGSVLHGRRLCDLIGGCLSWANRCCDPPHTFMVQKACSPKIPASLCSCFHSCSSFGKCLSSLWFAVMHTHAHAHTRSIRWRICEIREACAEGMGDCKALINHVGYSPAHQKVGFV